MRRAELAHVLRAACRITGDSNILVLGSQAILGSHSEHELPAAAWMSMEADVAFLHEDLATPKWAAVDGAIGELSQFHQTFSYYAQGEGPGLRCRSAQRRPAGHLDPARPRHSAEL